MKRFFPLLFITLAFVACKKEEAVVATSLPEQTLNDVSYGSDAVQRMDIYLPAGRTTTATKVMIMIHGGSWISGDKVDMNDYVKVLKAQLPDYAVLNINYRLAALPSTNTFPAQENDVKAAVAFALAKAGEYKFNVEKYVVVGASAGGHLGLLQAYKQTPKPKAVVDYFGPTDMTAMYNAFAGTQAQPLLALLMNGTPATNAALYQSSSPVNYVSASVSPTLILHGTADPVVPYTQAVALKNKLESVGASVKMVTYIGAGHGDTWAPALLDSSYTQVVNFLKEKNP